MSLLSHSSIIFGGLIIKVFIKYAVKHIKETQISKGDISSAMNRIITHIEGMENMSSLTLHLVFCTEEVISKHYYASVHKLRIFQHNFIRKIQNIKY